MRGSSWDHHIVARADRKCTEDRFDDAVALLHIDEFVVGRVSVELARLAAARNRDVYGIIAEQGHAIAHDIRVVGAVGERGRAKVPRRKRKVGRQRYRRVVDRFDRDQRAR